MKPVTLALLLSACVPAAARAQASADSVAAFLRAVETATARYADRSVAVREGFRRVGPDFPGMGEHWVQPGRLVSGRFRADAPPILTYAVIDGRVVLTGAAFGVPLSGAAQPPDFPSRALWHDHAASVDEESLLISPAAHGHGNRADTAHAHMRPRLAMLHVWFGVENPEGVFAQDNWALPYVRLGLTAPEHGDVGAARALSFLNGGDEYYRELFRAAAPLSPAELDAVDSLIVTFRTDLQAWLAPFPRSTLRSAAGTTELRQRWSLFWTHVRQSVSPTAWERLRSFAPGHR